MLEPRVFFSFSGIFTDTWQRVYPHPPFDICPSRQQSHLTLKKSCHCRHVAPTRPSLTIPTCLFLLTQPVTSQGYFRPQINIIPPLSLSLFFSPLSAKQHLFLLFFLLLLPLPIFSSLFLFFILLESLVSSWVFLLCLGLARASKEEEEKN